MKHNMKMNLQTMTISALLIAVAIVIPMFAPKIMFGPVSFTLASHVPIFIAMFISFPVAAAVTAGSTVGFFLAGFPLVIVLRALSHIVFVILGSLLLKRMSYVLSSPRKSALFGLLLAVVHAVCEVVVVTVFYFGTDTLESYYKNGYFTSVILLLGVGTIVHSMIDFGLAVFVWRPLARVIQIPVSARFKPKAKATDPQY